MRTEYSNRDAEKKQGFATVGTGLLAVCFG